MAENLDIQVTGEIKPNLPPLQLSPELQKAMDTDPMAAVPEEIPQLVSVVEIQRFLKAGYELHGAITYEDIWQQEDAWYAEIAELIAPDINKLAQRSPQVAYAIKAVNAAGGWGRLAFDYAKRWIRVNKRNAQKKAQKQEAKTNEPRPTEPRAAAAPIIDYQPAESHGPTVVDEPPAAALNVVQPSDAGGDIYRIDYTPSGS